MIALETTLDQESGLLAVSCESRWITVLHIRPNVTHDFCLLTCSICFRVDWKLGGLWTQGSTHSVKPRKWKICFSFGLFFLFVVCSQFAFLPSVIKKRLIPYWCIILKWLPLYSSDWQWHKTCCVNNVIMQWISECVAWAFFFYVQNGNSWAIITELVSDLFGQPG